MADLLYAEEHISCYHYDKQINPTIRVIELEKNEDRQAETQSSTISIILKGKGSLSFGKFINKPIKTGDIILLPTHTLIKIRAEEKLSILVFRLPPSFHFCDHFSLEALYNQGFRKKEGFYPLKVNQRIKAYTNALIPCLEDGLRCVFFLELKIKELFFLLRAYNTKEDLAAFFFPILSNDMEFHNFIMNNYQSVKTVKEFAQLANYSLTGFEKRFKKVFGISAHEWMKNQLASSLYHEISCSKKTFMQISDLYGFSSSAHFSNFCKSVFGKTPSIIRKEGTKLA